MTFADCWVDVNALGVDDVAQILDKRLQEGALVALKMHADVAETVEDVFSFVICSDGHQVDVQATHATYHCPVPYAYQP